MSEVLRAAKKRISDVRMTNVNFQVLENGNPLDNKAISYEMTGHDFLFGANCYAHGKLIHPGTEERFTEYFTHLFNYTMVPFHWNWYEPEKGKYNEPYTRNLFDWTKENKIKVKLHALIWHELCPDWVKDGKVEEEYKRRMEHLFDDYSEGFDFYDLINEITVCQKFDNPVSRWIQEVGEVEVFRFASELVRGLKKDAKLIYGDWNVHGQEYQNLLTKLREAGADFDYLGVQSHMHRDIWSHEEMQRVLDVTAEHGWPIHFPEFSLCSGKPLGIMSYYEPENNQYSETEEDLYWQADLTEEFYTILFAHPAVEAVSWFDFTDHRWLGAPAGLVDDHFKPKLFYGRLDDLINREWKSSGDLYTNEFGSAQARVYFGQYKLLVFHNGEVREMDVHLQRESFYENREATVEVTMDWDKMTPVESSRLFLG